MENYLNIMNETLESDKRLLDQYKKELTDINTHSGLSRFMGFDERCYAKRRLEESISSLEKGIKEIEKEIEEMKEKVV